MRFAGPGRVPPIPFTVPFFGMHYVGWLNDFVDWNVYFMGAYSPHELAFLADACRAIRLARGSVNCFDVGANVGQHSLFLSKHADQVVAFEPNPVPLRSLKAKAERNRLDNLRVIEAALGAREEELDLYLPNAFNTGTGSLKPETANDPVVAKVRVATLDGVSSELSLPRIDVLKMDVQGWEASVLEGGQRKLRADRPVILTEISRENLSGFGTMEGLRRLLYDEHTVFRIEGQRESYRLAPLAELPQLDLFEIAVVPNEMITAWDHALSELSGVA